MNHRPLTSLVTALEDRPLSLLLGGYINQDWPLDHATVWDAIDDFVAKEGAEAASAAAEDIRALAARALSEDELAQVLDALGSAYYAPHDGSTYAQWLYQVLARLT
jgi:hypothetical protein